jgi:hypothetical protein
MFNRCSVSKILLWPALILGFFLSGCSHTSELIMNDRVDEVEATDYSVIYYIHADSDYLYHNAAGEPVRGNSKVLDTALRSAEEAESGEVFVFYQRPQKRFLGLFPRRSSQMYHFTNGELTGHVKYRHSDKSEDFLTTEARLYDRYRSHSGERDPQSYFLYFGHEISDGDGKKYHLSLPDIAVNAGSFTNGIRKFLPAEEQRFNLVVLSTCNNGTPGMADHLMGVADVLLASPQNLHLSHVDTESLGLLESNPGISPIELAHSMADETYERLASEVQTAITLTVYDLEVVQNQKHELHTFVMAYGSLGSMQHFSDNTDCNQFEFFDDETFRQGIKTWYKPARFGRNSTDTTHSGWGCKPLIQTGQEL